MVDAVPSLCCMPFEIDAWGFDVAFPAGRRREREHRLSLRRRSALRVVARRFATYAAKRDNAVIKMRPVNVTACDESRG
jgi:hypothetical protein